jgi:hypothetical protein
MSYQLCLQAARENGQLEASLDTRKPKPPVEQSMQLLAQPFVGEPPRISGASGKRSLPN